MMHKLYFLLVTTCVLAMVIKSADSVACYACYYDDDYPNLQNSDIDCKSSRIDTNVVNTNQGRSCTASLYYRNGNLISVFRGAKNNQFQEFAILVQKNQNDFYTRYCNTDLCNGAATVSGGVAILSAIAVLAIWSSL